jgi:hypothetical protein
MPGSTLSYALGHFGIYLTSGGVADTYEMDSILPVQWPALLRLRNSATARWDGHDDLLDISTQTYVAFVLPSTTGYGAGQIFQNLIQHLERLPRQDTFT